MLSRRRALLAAVAATAAFAAPAFATETEAFTPDAFAAAQKAQRPILSQLMADPKFNNLVYFVVDFDSQKDAVKSFGARMQSTLIAFKGEHETGRSVGDTDRASIAALLNKTL